ncbi:hypothetical protein TrRE_jg1401 [Triparma retinervis]|uniref:FAD/NAD(P)-binding domain-containing protein n=1 Tax=Triparma retinervis TaxID=2557542 RepID=A0A9W6ZD86_9STRA|nr:hypothetical protein TrRE_jg1401 [Triparma retinervis]
MVPGCVSGLYTQAQTKINLEPLANYAGVTFVNAKVASADLDGCKLLLDNGSELVYDVVSFDIGSATRGHDEVKGAGEFSIPTRPISELVTRIEEAERGIGVDDDVEVVVVGGGAAGIELAFAIKARWGKERTGKTGVEILDSNNVLFPGESESCRGAVVKELSKRGIKVTHGAVVKEVREGEDDFLKLIMLGDGEAVGFRFGEYIRGRWVWELKDFIDVGFMDLFDVEKIGGGGTEEGGSTKDYDEHESEREKEVRVEVEGIDAETAGREISRTDGDVDVLRNWHIMKRMMREEGSEWFEEARRVWARRGA